jgi:hypothetical protein
LVERSCRDSDSSSSNNCRAPHIERRVADNHDVAHRRDRHPDRASPLHRDRHETIPIGMIVAEGAACEIAPEVEMFELQASRACEITGEQRAPDDGTGFERVEQAAHTRHDAFTRSREQDLSSQQLAVAIVKARARRSIRAQALTSQRLNEDERIGATCRRHALEALRGPENLFERARQGSHARAA